MTGVAGRSFTHVHVASGYSLRYGASSPAALAERAAGQGMTALALTDRDGVYGAVKFALACRRWGIDPILGVDLAVEPTARDPRPVGAQPVRRTPARGGVSVDPRHPRVTVLALGAGRGPDGLGELGHGRGWARLVRLVSATHLRGERGRPVATLDLVAQHAREVAPHSREAAGTGAGAALVVLLGPGSELGQAALARRPDLARAVLGRWLAALPSGALAVEVVCHDGPDGTPGCRAQAARMLSLARQAGIPAVLTNAVRHADPEGAVTVDVLDAVRRLVPLAGRHVDRVTAQGYLKSGHEMACVAHDVARAAGAGADADAVAARLLADTEALARRCRQDLGLDLGIGSVHFPETAVLGLPADATAAEVDADLRARCEGGLGRRYPGASSTQLRAIRRRLDEELAVITGLGYPAYFLTVGKVCDLIRGMGVRVAARGSGAGSMVNYLLGISGVDPIRHGLSLERFLSPLRAELPDIDVDVESDRRTEVYEQILAAFGAERVTCVSMMDTYRVRHAVRDVGAALGMPPGEVDAIAKAFPHIRARDARAALAELPELRASGLAAPHLELLFDLVEGLDALPRHVALHPCGVVLSNSGLLDRTPVEASWLGFPMSQFDKDDVEEIGLLKLDVLGVRMQSSMAHALSEIARVDGEQIDLDAVPLDDRPTFELISSTRTLGCFQIESPGQRELIGKFGPETFDDLITDISLFRPGPVKSDMVTPFLLARQGWTTPDYLHPRFEPALAETYGVVVFHEQILKIVAEATGCTLAEADEVRRALGTPDGQLEVEAWLRPAAREAGFTAGEVERIWQVLKAFASFGFCKAHAAAFALPTYQSAWLKAHHPAAFLAGVLTHDPGMYPKRLILEDARQLGIAVLPLDVNASDSSYRVEPVPPDGRRYGIRLALADVKGISDTEIARIIAGRPYHSLADFWHRAQPARPVAERLVVAGGFDALYGIGSCLPVRRRGAVTRRDLLLQVAELDRWTRATSASGGRGARKQGPSRAALEPGGAVLDGVRAAAARQSQAPRAVDRARAGTVQLALDLGDSPDETVPSGLPEMTAAERVRAELEVLGLDASHHVAAFYAPLMDALGVTRSRDLLRRRSRAELLVAGVKVATQTPPVRSGRRVVFLTLDDTTGPVDATFFEDVQGPYAATVFGSWLLLVRGELRRTGPRGVSLRATGAWELPQLWDIWRTQGLAEVQAVLAASPRPVDGRGSRGYDERAVVGAAASRSTRPVMAGTPVAVPAAEPAAARAGGMGGGERRRVLVHPSGFRQSPYADIKPAGEDGRDPRRIGRSDSNGAPRKLWHSSPGSSGR